MKNGLDEQYIDLLTDILENGVEKNTRNGKVLSVFGRTIRYKFKDGKFPLLTTKKMAWKSICTELLWFLRGDTNIKYLVDNDCHIWDGDAYIKGSGATSGTNGLVIQDSAGVNIYTFRNDGQAISTIRNAQTEASLRFTQVTANNNAGTSIPIIWYENTAASQRGVINGVWDSSNRAGFNFIHGQGTTGVSILLNNPSNQLVGGSTFTINETFNPTSGTAFRVFANIAPTINQTGGANGITYGLSVNPTLTAAADWRSITWTNNSGWGLYGQGTANNYINGGLFIGTTTTSTYKLDIVGNARVNGVSRLGSAVATNGATTIEQIYVGDQVLGVISARQGSGALLLGYGAKAKSGADGYISTFDNFSARRALLDINQGYFDFVNTAAVNTAIGSDLTPTILMRLNTTGNLLIGSTTDSSLFVRYLKNVILSSC